jgi:hypothetical protein
VGDGIGVALATADARGDGDGAGLGLGVAGIGGCQPDRIGGRCRSSATGSWRGEAVTPTTAAPGAWLVWPASCSGRTTDAATARTAANTAPVVGVRCRQPRPRWPAGGGFSSGKRAGQDGRRPGR